MTRGPRDRRDEPPHATADPPAHEARPRARAARTSPARSRSSWTATAAGRRRAACPSPPATAPARGRCGAPSRPRIDLGVESLCVYAFSTENWSRPAGRGRGAHGDLRRDDRARASRPRRARACACASSAGATGRPRRCCAKMSELEEATRRNERLQLWIAFDYGGRAEIVEAARRLVEEGVDPRDVDENAIASRLYAPDMPEPDLLIRTSGELRISNFLLWQVAYTELVFVDTLWPDFGERQLREALAEYASRRRRFGGTVSPPARAVAVIAAGLPLVLGAAWLGGWCAVRARRRGGRSSRCTSSTAWAGRCGRSCSPATAGRSRPARRPAGRSRVDARRLRRSRCRSRSSSPPSRRDAPVDHVAVVDDRVRRGLDRPRARLLDPAPRPRAGRAARDLLTVLVTVFVADTFAYIGGRLGGPPQDGAGHLARQDVGGLRRRRVGGVLTTCSRALRRADRDRRLGGARPRRRRRPRRGRRRPLRVARQARPRRQGHGRRPARATAASSTASTRSLFAGPAALLLRVRAFTLNGLTALTVAVYTGRVRRIALLGATGSIGRQALEVIDAHPELELCAGRRRARRPIDGLRAARRRSAATCTELLDARRAGRRPERRRRLRRPAGDALGARARHRPRARQQGEPRRGGRPRAGRLGAGRRAHPAGGQRALGARSAASRAARRRRSTRSSSRPRAGRSAAAPAPSSPT